MKISTAKPATAFYNTKKNNSALTISSFLAAKTLQRTLINYRVQSLPVSHRHKFLRNVCQLWKQETCNYFLYSYFLMNFVKLFSQHRQTSATLIGIWLIAFRKGRSAAASLYLNIKKKNISDWHRVKNYCLQFSSRIIISSRVSSLAEQRLTHAFICVKTPRVGLNVLPRSRLSGGRVAATRRQTAHTRSALMTDAAAAAAAAAGIDQTATSCSCAPWWILVVSSLRSKKCFPCLISSDKY